MIIGCCRGNWNLWWTSFTLVGLSFLPWQPFGLSSLGLRPQLYNWPPFDLGKKSPTLEKEVHHWFHSSTGHFWLTCKLIISFFNLWPLLHCQIIRPLSIIVTVWVLHHLSLKHPLTKKGSQISNIMSKLLILSSLLCTFRTLFTKISVPSQTFGNSILLS